MKEVRCAEQITCPYCGHEHNKSWEMGGASVIACPACEEDFWFEAVSVIRYYSRPIEEDGSHVYF